VRRVFSQWLLSLNSGYESAFPSLKTYLIKTVRDFIEFEHDERILQNQLFSTWDFLVADVHVDSTQGHNWGESIDLSLYEAVVKDRVICLSSSLLTQTQIRYLRDTAAEANIIKQYENTKRIQ